MPLYVFTCRCIRVPQKISCTYTSRSVNCHALNEDINVRRTRIETRIEDFPLRESEFSTGMAKWVNEDDRMLMAFGIPPYPSPYPAYPFVRPAVPSRHRSYIDARFRGECQSVDNLFERRASNVSYLRNRARASGVRCGILDFAPFSMSDHCLLHVAGWG